MLPEFTAEGELPQGVHVVPWKEFCDRFRSGPRREWLITRLEAILAIAAQTGMLERVFVWGSFVTAKPFPRDLDLLLLMAPEFELTRLPSELRKIFDSAEAKILFDADIFWARASIGDEVLRVWLETYQTTRDFRKRGIVELRME